MATVGDLQALAQAGLDFNGNNTDAVVHRPLGTKLEIVGDSPATNFASAVGNINVFGDPTNKQISDSVKQGADEYHEYRRWRQRFSNR